MSGFPFFRVTSQGAFGALQGLLDIGFAVLEANKPKPALDRANALFQKAAPQMSEPGRVMSPHIVPVIQNWSFRSARFQNHRMEDQSRALRPNRNPVTVSAFPQAIH